jgi:hypothetical protein
MTGGREDRGHSLLDEVPPLARPDRLNRDLLVVPVARRRSVGEEERLAVRQEGRPAVGRLSLLEAGQRLRGSSPVEAIQIASYNGAVFLGKADRIGSITPGLAADLLVVKGDPSVRIEEIEKPALVFKDGVGYEPGKLLESVRGRYGQY